MKKISLLALVAAFALVGAGCVSTIEIEDLDSEEVDEVSDVQEGDTEEEPIFTLGYDEGTPRVFDGKEESSTGMVYGGQQILEAKYTFDFNLSCLYLELAEEEAVKLPEATGGELEHYCIGAGADLLEYQEDLEFVGEATLRIGKVETNEVASATVWTIELLEVMAEQVEGVVIEPVEVDADVADTTVSIDNPDLEEPVADVVE
jgi:hypothetical protein